MTTGPVITGRALREPAPEAGPQKRGSATNCRIVSTSRDTGKEETSTEQKADAAVRSQHLPRQGLGEEPVVGLRLEGRRQQCTERSEGLGAGEKAAPEKAAATSALPHTYSQELGKPHVTTSSLEKSARPSSWENQKPKNECEPRAQLPHHGIIIRTQ